MPNCIDDGEDQQDCGRSARSWYRECLESRCDQATIDLDNCRTSCRIDKRKKKTIAILLTTNRPA